MTQPGVVLDVARRWDGEPLPSAAHGRVCLGRAGEMLVIEVDAPYYGDAPPPGPPGPTDRLWEHEVVEVFVAGPEERYLEVELGPHGHHLVLRLEGVRRPVQSRLAIDYLVEPRPPAATRFVARAHVPASYLPLGPLTANAYAVHCGGAHGAMPCHHAHAPVPGAAPDFHRLECFVPIAL